MSPRKREWSRGEENDGIESLQESEEMRVVDRVSLRKCGGEGSEGLVVETLFLALSSSNQFFLFEEEGGGLAKTRQWPNQRHG